MPLTELENELVLIEDTMDAINRILNTNPKDDSENGTHTAQSSEGRKYI